MANDSNKRSVLFKCAFAASLGFIAYRMHAKSKTINTKRETIESKVLRHWSNEVIKKDDQSSCKDLQELAHFTDHFNGIRVDSERLPKVTVEFSSKLKYSLNKWTRDGFRGIFLKLPISLAGHLEV